MGAGADSPPAPAWVRALDRLSAATGAAVAWLTVAMVGLGVWNALARWLGRWAGADLASNGLIEAQWYAFSVVFLLGASDALRTNAHVRVDVLYSRASARRRAWIDLAGTVFLGLPFCVALVLLAWPGAAESFAIRERSADPGGLPRWPLRALIPVGFALLTVQAVSEGAKRAYALWRAAP